MKKLYALLFLSIFAFAPMQAQIFEDDFDGYTSGVRLAEQAGLPWTTWSENPGSNEDPYVSAEQSETAPNSVKIASGNDNVLLLGDSLTGRYLVSFYIYIPANKYGYYNILQEFAGSNSQWGTQVYFDANGQGSIDAGAEGAATFSYNYDTWFEVENYIDLDNDWAEVFIDGNYLIGWQWTLGTFGTPGPKQLGAVNFYAWDVNGTPEFYFDNVVFESSPLGDAPQNLTADVVGQDVTLTWDPPATGTVFTYYTFRNDELLGISPELTFEDYIELPGTYNYTVKAFYLESGLSAPAGPVEVIISGGTDRELVLLEIGTGTECVFCPGSAMGADDLIENGHEVAVIEYHSYSSGDPYNTPEAADRTSYYGITGYPTAMFDGGNAVVGGSSTQSLYTTYAPIVDNSITKPSWFDLEIDLATTNEMDFDVTITGTKIYDYTGANMSVFLVLTESHIPYNWFGQTVLDFVCREMYPSSAGTLSTFTLDVPVVIDFSINVPYDINNCELVAFIQDVDTKEVMQTTKMNLGQFVGLNEMGEKYTKIYPNPATNNVTIESGSHMEHIRIFNLSGQKVYEVALDQNEVELNIEFLKQGIYMINIETENGTRIEKLNVF
ncbi:MAG: T9SS type A sorting domain-containing protein [Bacteroidetes bacterium]|nr:T9SS type A sorting domain-containing protein [Bacteroidota bacterium]